MFEVGVTNPVAGLTTVAVAPFFNLSEEPTVDGRRFAQAYYTALQQTPGFEVVPVGVVELAIHKHRLEMNSPEDALKLAEILQVDAVVVGAVTDYSPYYPPRIGQKVSWYSPYAWEFIPGIPMEEDARKAVLRSNRGWNSKKSSGKGKMLPCPPEGGPDCQPQQQPPPQMQPQLQAPAAAVRGQSPSGGSTASAVPDDTAGTPDAESSFWVRWNPWRRNGVVVGDPWPPNAVEMSPSINAWDQSAMVFDPRQPLMSYVRMFDGADPKLTARLRDYRELSGDLRSGGWEAYLHRSEDFIRFTSHLMVVEMLQLHGGESQRRVVWKVRKQK